MLSAAPLATILPPFRAWSPSLNTPKLVTPANRSCPAKGQGDAATSRTKNTNEGNSSRSANPLSRPSGAAFAQSCSLLAIGLGRGAVCRSPGSRPTAKKRHHSDPGGTRNRIFPTIFPPHNSNIPDGGEGRGVAGESRRLGCGVESCWKLSTSAATQSDKVQGGKPRFPLAGSEPRADRPWSRRRL